MTILSAVFFDLFSCLPNVLLPVIVQLEVDYVA